MMSIGYWEIPITRTNKRILTKTRHEEKELGANNQGITQPLEVTHEPRFACLRYTKGECSKVLDLFKTSSRKENDGKTSPSSHGNSHYREKAEASSHCHTDIRDSKGRMAALMRHERPSTHHEKNQVKQIWRKKTYCSHCDINGHQRATCWKLHPEQRLKDKASVREPGRAVVR